MMKLGMDIPSLIKIDCIIKKEKKERKKENKARVKLAAEPNLFMHFWCFL